MPYNTGRRRCFRMKIKEVARKTGLTEKTIRYYEHRGLVIPSSTAQRTAL